MVSVDELIEALEPYRGKQVRGWSVSYDFFRKVNIRTLIFEERASDRDQMELLSDGEGFVYLS